MSDLANNIDESLVTGLILPILKDLIKPKIEKIFGDKSFSITEQKASEDFQKYLTDRYTDLLTIDTLVFANKQTMFKRLYQPLTLIIHSSLIVEENREVKINKFHKKLLPEFYRVIIEDTAGMGKSTISRMLFLSAIEEKAGVPILIELRHINVNNDFLTEIQNQLSPIGKKFSQSLLLKFLEAGDFIFLLDGFDEIPLTNKGFVIKEMHNFIKKAKDNYFLITSRQEEPLASFGDFQKTNIRPLERHEAYDLIRKYDVYSYKPIAEDLIKNLEETNDSSLTEYLTNPFLVSLLYKSYDYKKEIPVKKNQFYQQVYDALFSAHDLSKEGYLKREKNSNLHSDDFERVLRYIGYLTAIENKVEYDKNTIISIIDRAKNYLSDLDFKASDFLKDLLETVPLFKEESNNYKWSHKSLQDYFAAKFIWIDAKEKQESILRKIYQNNRNIRFANLLDIFYELDPKAFESTILFWFLEDFKNYTLNNYKDFDYISETDYKERVALTFTKKFRIVFTNENITELKSINDNPVISNYFAKYFGPEISRVFYKIRKENNNTILVFIESNYALETVFNLIKSKIPSLVNFKIRKLEVEDLLPTSGELDIELDDTKNNPLNSIEHFSVTNKLITTGLMLDYDVALKYFTKITNAKSFENNDELTNW